MENNNYRVVFSSDAMSDTTPHISHYGKKGMKWGVVHEELPNATVYSFRGAPPRSMTGDNRVKATQTPSVSSSGRNPYSINSNPSRTTPNSGAKSADPFEWVVYDADDFGKYYDAVENLKKTLSSDLGNAALDPAQIELFATYPNQYRIEISRVRTLVNSLLTEAYKKLDTIGLKSPKPMYQKFRQDMLKSMHKSKWLGLAQVMDTTGSATGRDQWRETRTSKRGESPTRFLRTPKKQVGGR